MPDLLRFESARARVLLEENKALGIGTLAEKTMHGILKLYFEPDDSYHEIECLGSVADILRDGYVTEIQTGSLFPLLPKLKRLLPHYRIRVVHPLLTEKYIRYLDRETGEITPPRKSPAVEKIFDLAFDLFRLSEVICNENLTLTLVSLRCEEIRVKDGRRTRRGVRSSLFERIPTALLSEESLATPDDYLRALLPESLFDGFTVKDYLRSIGSRSRYAQYALRLLISLGLLERERIGRSYVYKRVNNGEPSDG